MSVDPLPGSGGFNLQARVDRAVRLATSRLRPLPDALIIGGIRCGSTSLHDYLDAGGYVRAGSGGKKEVHYFDWNYARGENWYRAWFPIRPSGPTYESTPSYLATPEAPDRARALLPEARLFVVLRHPLVRAESHFAWRTSRGQEFAATLADAFAEEPARMARGELITCYRHHSGYAAALQRWYDAYPAEQICVVIAEKLFAGDPDELARLSAAAGTSPDQPFPKVNRGPRSDGAVRSDGVDPALFDDEIRALEALLGRSTGWLADA